MTGTTTAGSPDEHVRWRGYNCENFTEYLAQSPYGRFVGDSWLTDPLCVAFVERLQAVDEQTWPLRAVYASFVVVGLDHRSIEAVVAPKLACEVLSWEAGGDDFIVTGIEAVGDIWDASAQQIGNWCAGAEAISSSSNDIGEALCLIEEVRDSAKVFNVNMNAACDAFAALTSVPQSGDFIVDEEFIEAAIAAVR